MPLDYVKCAEVHNKIVRIGWEATGRKLENGSFQPFWDSCQAKHGQLQATLAPEIIAFYKSALMPRNIEQDDEYQNFFYFCSGLAPPLGEFSTGATEYLNQNQEGTRYIVLYFLSHLGDGNRIGSYQQTGNAIMQPNLFSIGFDTSFVPSSGDLPWKPLEEVLQSFIDMIDVNKVVPGCYREVIQPLSMADPQHPWKLLSYSEQIGNITLEAYSSLIKAIEDRMPETQDTQETTQSLATKELLDRAEFPSSCFARSFLERAQRPRRVRFIAPGISLPTEHDLIEQPFKDLARKHQHATLHYGKFGHIPQPEDKDPMYPPFLFFPATDSDGGQSRTTLPSGPLVERTFEWPFDSLKDLPSGLYLDTCRPWSAAAFEDASVFLLPYAVGGHAQYNDGPPFEPPLMDELYQTRVNPFIPAHRTQLHLILDSWKIMVEKGFCEVGEEGVMGGIEKFREVEKSREVAGRYTAALHW